MEKLDTDLRELTEHEVDAVNGGILPFIIAAAVVCTVDAVLFGMAMTKAHWPA